MLPFSPCKTRWGSFAAAAERYIELHDDLRAYSLSPEAADVDANIVAENVLSDLELVKLAAVMPVFKMLSEASLLLEMKEQSTGVNAIFILNNVYQQIDGMTSAGISGSTKAAFATSVRNELKKKFNRAAI